MAISRSARVLRSAFALSWVALGSWVACDGGPAPSPASVAAPAGSPMGELSAPRTADPWNGVVETRLAAGSYTYLAVRDDSGLRWVATTGAGVPTGSAVTVQSFGTRKDFYSRRLDRSFAELEFASVSLDEKSR